MKSFKLGHFEIAFLRVKDDRLKAFPGDIRALELRSNAKLVFQIKLTLLGV